MYRIFFILLLFITQIVQAGGNVSIPIGSGNPKKKNPDFVVQDMRWDMAQRIATDIGHNGVWFNGDQTDVRTSLMKLGIVQMAPGTTDFIDFDIKDYIKQYGVTCEQKPDCQLEYLEAQKIGWDLCNGRGYVGGFLTGHNGYNTGTLKTGAFCIKYGAANTIPVTDSEMHFSPYRTWDDWARRAQIVCKRHKYIAGFVTGYWTGEGAWLTCITEHAAKIGASFATHMIKSDYFDATVLGTKD